MEKFVTHLKVADHRNQKVLCIYFPKLPQALLVVKKLPCILWSQTMACWYLPFSNEHLDLALNSMKQFGYVDYVGIHLARETVPPKPEIKKAAISHEAELQIVAFQRWMQSRRYSTNTIKTYSEAVKSFLGFYATKKAAEISNQDLLDFNNDYIIKNKLSASYQNQVVNGVKLFFRQIENRKLDVELVHRPKRNKLLPNVLSKEEVKQILDAHINIKHRIMLSIIYSCGLRRSELLNLKPADIDSKRKLIIIRQSKGRKDRIVPLSDKILNLLREYFLASKPKVWLFEGQTEGQPYDERSLASVLKQAVSKAKITKPVTLHWLRHSYATHLLESGTDLRYIQEILGHSSSKTTEIYTHVSTKSIQNIVSPFDTL